MTYPNSKIESITKKTLSSLVSDKEVTSLGYGHFNIIHPGHIRYLQHGKSLGKHLYIAILGDSQIINTKNHHYFSEWDRAIGLASLNIVDRVFVLNEVDLSELILKLHPSFLVLGKEFLNSDRKDIKDAINACYSYNGQVEYHAGEVHYASSDLFHGSMKSIELERKQLFIQSCKRQNVNIKDLVNIINNFKNLNLLVIGDTIVDQYIACDPIGMSAEAPVLVVKELESVEFVGGAGIVSSHIKALGANCSFLSVVGKDENASHVRNALENQDISVHLIEDNSRPTTFKIRYMVENQKLFRVSRMKEHHLTPHIEELLINKLVELVDHIDGIVVCDFVYGVITAKVLHEINRLAKEKNIMLFGDLQCSSQVGNISKFEDFNLLCPTEREARIALGNQDDGIEWIANTLLERTRATHLIIKLGAEGFVTYSKSLGEETHKEHFPALTSNPVDVAGAGDSLLAAMATCLASGSNIMEASAIGACVASIAVQTIGNVPISQKQLILYLNNLEII